MEEILLSPAMLSNWANESEALRNLTAEGNDTCSPYEKNNWLETKIWLVGVVGTGTALGGIVSNSLLVYVFFRPSVRVGSAILYLAVLAMLDIWMLVTYILIFPLNIWYDYFELLFLFRFWMFYVRPMLTISKIIQLASTYLIISATVERFLSQYGVRCSLRKRLVIISCVILGSVALRWSTYLEITVVYRPNCTGFSEKDITQSDLAMDPIYQKVVAYYLAHIIQVFLPFVVLLLLNSLILARMRRQTLQTTAQDSRQQTTICLLARHPASQASGLVLREKLTPTDEASLQRQIMLRIESKKQLREATHMLIVVVFCYLLVNSVSLFVTTMEHVTPAFLFQHRKFYSLAVDCISLLSVVNSSTRFIIYYLFNGAIRREYKTLFQRIAASLCGYRKYKSVRQTAPERPRGRTYENGNAGGNTVALAETTSNWPEIVQPTGFENNSTENEGYSAFKDSDAEMDGCLHQNNYHVEVSRAQMAPQLTNGLVMREKAYESCL